MDRLATLRNAGFTCSLPHCLCAEELANTLTDEQAQLLEVIPAQSGNHKNAAEFISTLNDAQRSITRKIAEAVLKSERVIVFIPRFDNDDDEAETPEQLARNIARVEAEQRART